MVTIPNTKQNILLFYSNRNAGSLLERDLRCGTDFPVGLLGLPAAFDRPESRSHILLEQTARCRPGGVCRRAQCAPYGLWSMRRGCHTMPSMGVVLEVRELVKEYPTDSGSVRALDAISLSVEEGEFVAIMGASGSGKSTLTPIAS